MTSESKKKSAASEAAQQQKHASSQGLALQESDATPAQPSDDLKPTQIAPELVSPVPTAEPCTQSTDAGLRNICNLEAAAPARSEEERKPDATAPELKSPAQLVDSSASSTTAAPWTELRKQMEQVDKLLTAIEYIGPMRQRLDELSRELENHKALSNSRDEVLSGIEAQSREHNALLARFVQFETSTSKEVNKLNHEMQSGEARLKRLEEAYHKFIAAERPDHGSVSVRSTRPSPDVLSERLKQLASALWQEVIGGVASLAPSDAGPNDNSLRRAAIAHTLSISMFSRYSVECNLELAIGHFGKIFPGINLESLTTLRDLAQNCHQLVVDVDSSEPRSWVFFPPMHEGLPYDENKYEAHSRSPVGQNAKVRYFFFPGYRTETQEYSLPVVFNEVKG